MNKSKDSTIERNYLQRFNSLVLEYELVKQKNHPKYKLVKDLFKDHRIAHQNFSKYYNRYLQQNKDINSLKPLKRGPKYKSRRIDLNVEHKIIELRSSGLNKFEIFQIIKSENILKTPSLTTIYNYCVKHNLNLINKPMKELKVRYVREKAGELAHVDCHNLGRNIIDGISKNFYIVSIVDDCTRLAWAEIVTDIKSLTVMFSVLKSMNMLRLQYGIEFEEILSDNGPEFGNKGMKAKNNHPFERMLIEMNIKHRYTRAYRPQTNGKVERFWKTLHLDLIDETDFSSLDELKDELLKYMYYYNSLRPHQALNGNSPSQFYDTIKHASN